MATFTVEQIDLDDDRIAFVEAKAAGWAGTIKCTDLHNALEDAGVPSEVWPSEPSPNKCLERAVKELASDRRTLVRPLKGSKGWTVVIEDAEALDLEVSNLPYTPTAHTLDLTARVKKVYGQHIVEVTPWDHPLVPRIKRHYADWLGRFKAPHDLSQWFTQTVIPWCSGVATRSRGGSYYVLRGEPLERLEKCVRALHKVSNTSSTTRTVGGIAVPMTSVMEGGRIVIKPELASTVAVEVLLENFLNECDLVSDNVEKSLSNTNLGHRALKTQAGVAKAQAEKIALVERMLDTQLDDVRNTMLRLESEAGVAALAAMDDD